MAAFGTPPGSDDEWLWSADEVSDTGAGIIDDRIQTGSADDAGTAQPPTPDRPQDLVSRAASTQHERPRKKLLRAPRKMVRRLSWGIADQGMSSFTNFAVGIYVVRTLGAVQFGAFTIAFVTYAFALNASRGLATDPLMVRFSGVDVASWRRAVASCTGTALAVGIATGACVLSATIALSGTLRLAFLALGLTLPGLLLQDSWRYSFFALGRGGHAFLNDTIWAMVLLPALVLVKMTGHANVFWLVLAWGTSATVAAAVGPLQAQVAPRITGAWGWLSRHRDLGTRYLAEGISSAGAGQLRSYAIALILGLAPLGYVQAATTITGPVAILFLGMALVTIPEAARVLRRSPKHLPLFCVLVSAGLAAGAFVWGIFLLVAMPRGFGALLIGHIWHETYPLVLPQTVYLVGQGVAGGAGTGLHALGAARRSLRTVVLGSILLVICPLAGAAMGGAVGTVRGTALAAWLGALVSWWQLRAALRESGTKPVAAVFAPSSRGERPLRPVLAISPMFGERVVVAVSVGEMLAEARYRTGLTVAQLSRTVGIPETVVWAIERNDYAAFADHEYAKSHIRLIARAVGANPVPLLEEYDAEIAEPREIDSAIGFKGRPRTMAGARRRGLWLAIPALGLLLAAAAVFYHTHVLASSERRTYAPPTATRIPVHRQAPPRRSRQATSRSLGDSLIPVSAAAFGPSGLRDGDNPQTALLALGSNSSMAWKTSWYATSHFGGLQAGTGLLLDMGRPVKITSLRIILGRTRGADFQLRVGDVPAITDLRTVARSADAFGVVRLQIRHPRIAQYLLVWFTALPPETGGQFEESVYGVTVVGRG